MTEYEIIAFVTVLFLTILIVICLSVWGDICGPVPPPHWVFTGTEWDCVHCGAANSTSNKACFVCNAPLTPPSIERGY